MEVRPLTWSVVVAGRWNVAILTPQWIAERLFDLKEAEAIQVEVALDDYLPHRVKVHGVVVVASADRLVFEPEIAGAAQLGGARKLASKVLEVLPETPVQAAGFNIRYRIEDPDSHVLEAFGMEIDKRLADSGYTPEARAIGRTLSFRDGRLNMKFAVDIVGAVEFGFNFHRESKSPDELRKWLALPLEEIEDAVAKIMRNVFNAELATVEIGHERDGLEDAKRDGLEDAKG